MSIITALSAVTDYANKVEDRVIITSIAQHGFDETYVARGVRKAYARTYVILNGHDVHEYLLGHRMTDEEVVEITLQNLAKLKEAQI